MIVQNDKNDFIDYPNGWFLYSNQNDLWNNIIEFIFSEESPARGLFA